MQMVVVRIHKDLLLMKERGMNYQFYGCLYVHEIKTHWQGFFNDEERKLSWFQPARERKKKDKTRHYHFLKFEVFLHTHNK